MRGAVVPLLAALLIASPVQAGCYGQNEGAGVTDHIYGAYGVRGRLDHRAATPLAGATIVHPMQIIGADLFHFLGAGTMKGKGIADTSCSDNWTSSWRVYLDGHDYNDQYFCNNTWGSVASTAQDVRLTIQYMTSCNGAPRWGVYWDGDLLTCKSIAVTTGRGAVGGESVYTAQTQDLEVEYELMQYRTSAGTWSDWVPYQYCEDPPYSVVTISDTEHWIEIP